MEILWKGTVSAVLGNSPETTRKLCLSTKFIYQEIRWNYDIFRSVKQWLLLGVAIVQYLSGNTHMGQGIKEWTKQNLWKTAFKKLEVISSVLYSINFSWSILKYYDPYNKRKKEKRLRNTPIIKEKRHTPLTVRKK